MFINPKSSGILESLSHNRDAFLSEGKLLKVSGKLLFFGRNKTDGKIYLVKIEGMTGSDYARFENESPKTYKKVINNYVKTSAHSMPVFFSIPDKGDRMIALEKNVIAALDAVKAVDYYCCADIPLKAQPGETYTLEVYYNKASDNPDNPLF